MLAHSALVVCPILPVVTFTQFSPLYTFQFSSSFNNIQILFRLTRPQLPLVFWGWGAEHRLDKNHSREFFKSKERYKHLDTGCT